MYILLVKATILEEMPPFPERESSILAKLKKKRPDKVANNTIEPRASNASGNADNDAVQPSAPVSPALFILWKSLQFFVCKHRMYNEQLLLVSGHTNHILILISLAHYCYD